MGETIGVVQFGCGPIGCSIARLAAQRPELAVLGGIDIDPAVAGRNLGEVAATVGRLEAVVHADAAAALKEAARNSLRSTAISSSPSARAGPREQGRCPSR